MLERLRNLGSARRDDDRVIRRCRGPAECPIGVHDMDVAVAESRQRRSRFFGKLADPLDRVDFCCNLGQHGRRVAGARADFEHPFAALQIQRLRHQRHDIGLGDGLPGIYGERRILIGEFPQTLRKKRHARPSTFAIRDNPSP